MSLNREWLAEVIRDWIHEQDFSLCGMGADECPDWPKAYELADRILVQGEIDTALSVDGEGSGG